MARENFVLLHGQILALPKIYQSAEGELTRAIMAVKVLRRPYLGGQGQIVGGKLYVDCPIILTADHGLIQQIADMEQGDMVDIRGVLTTREVTKSTVCSQCGHKNSAPGVSTYITPIYVCRREQKVDTVTGFEYLKARNEISNLVIVIGTLCRPPKVYSDDQHSSTQYQLAVNRKYHIRDNSSVRTDYPWVQSFGRQAQQDAVRLQEGANVYVNGGLQTREVVRNCTCENCGFQYTWQDSASEIIPYSTEYLTGCLFPERNEAGKEEEA